MSDEIADRVGEERARVLLAGAAATVEVAERPPLPAPRSRRRPVMLAAAVVVIAVLVVAIGRLGVDRAVPDAVPSPAPRVPTAPALDPARATAAETFIAWARGRGAAPRFAARVRNMLAGADHFGAPRWNDRPGERASWAGCSGLGFPDCGLDPVAVVLREPGRPRIAAGRPPCADGALPVRYAGAGADIVRLEAPGGGCAGWVVELWIDHRGEIYAVNLARGLAGG
ncbi:hypothetical protein GCM10022237_32890 [Nocardioides ginsengisoli]|uniref:Uncharacterized protein n=1 Tax=Nocardioides ginsengisoli TaxID=363868 RepID=A0ABW3W760_9ACTN